MEPLTGVLIGGGLSSLGSLVGGGLQSSAQKKANKLAGAMFRYQKDTQAPYVQAGRQSLADLMALMQDPSTIQDTAGYQFRFGEGKRALEGNMAARGGLLGGAALKRLTQYGQGFASNEFQNQFNRLSQLAGIGQGAANAMTGAAANYGQAAMSGQTALGNIGASTALGFAGGINNALNTYLNYDLGQKMINSINPAVGN